MPRYMIERVFDDAVEEDMGRIGSNSRRIIEDDFPDMKWVHSYVVSDDAGIKTFCIYDAPDEERLRAHAEKLGEHTISQLYEVGAVVAPTDFAP
jgi:hypothetical protein